MKNLLVIPFVIIALLQFVDQNAAKSLLKTTGKTTGETVNSIIARINDLENDLRTEKTERRKLEQTVNIFRNDISNLQLVGNQMKNNVKTIKSRLRHKKGKDIDLQTLYPARLQHFKREFVTRLTRSCCYCREQVK